MRPKKAVIQVRVDVDLAQLLQQDADRRRLAVSAWVRALLAQHYADELAKMNGAKRE